MRVLMSLNVLADRCGYFFNLNHTEGFEDKPDVNNGYNCSHPEAWTEEGVGCCFAHSCPVACRADGIDCKKYGNSCESCGNEECECDYDMMMCDIEDDQFDARYMYKEPAAADAGKGETTCQTD